MKTNYYITFEHTNKGSPKNLSLFVSSYYDLDELTHLEKFVDQYKKIYKDFCILFCKKLKDTKTDEIECPECQRMFQPPEICECGYEHQCGGPKEACEIPGCPECGAK